LLPVKFWHNAYLKTTSFPTSLFFSLGVSVGSQQSQNKISEYSPWMKYAKGMKV
jgi:hypothetical protein